MPRFGRRSASIEEPTTLLREATRVFQGVGASSAGVSGLFALTGFLSETAYARLLGVDLHPPAAELVLGGGQFFLALATRLTWLCVPVLLTLALLWGLHSAVLRRRGRVASAWARLRGRLAESPRWLIRAQLAVWAWFLLHGIGELADLVPFVQLLGVGDGLLAAAPELLREGDRHFTSAILWTAGSLGLLCGLELWRIRVAKALPERGSRQRLALFLSLPLYLAVLVHLVALPVGYGMLQIPLTRVYSARTVSFKDDLADAALRGKTLRLVVLRQSGSRYSFYCPRGGRAFWDIEERHLLSVADEERGPLLSLLQGSEWPAGCIGTGRSTSDGREIADASGGPV
jgi:hypothetical protein